MFLFTVTLTHCGNSIPILQREYMTSQGSQANKMQIRNVFPALLITIASAYRTLHKITALEVFVGWIHECSLTPKPMLLPPPGK